MEASAAAVWLNYTFAGFDQAITAGIHRLYDWAGWLFTPLFELISLMGKGGIFLILLSFCLIFFKKTRRFGTAMLLGVTIGAIFTNLFIKVVIARPRPYADENGFYYPIWQLLGSHTESDKSFPSGHTTAAFAAMVPVFLIGKRRIGIPALLFGVLMGISRIYLVVHYPSDVLAGFVVGCFAGVLGTLISFNVIPGKFYSLDFYKPKPKPVAAAAPAEETKTPEEPKA